jgi:hypothetical protein
VCPERYAKTGCWNLARSIHRALVACSPRTRTPRWKLGCFDNYVSKPQQKIVFKALRPPEQRAA